MLEKGERVKGEWEYNGGDTLVPSTLYPCMELSQRNLLIWLLYAN
jgi:hypothetical protein